MSVLHLHADDYAHSGNFETFLQNAARKGREHATVTVETPEAIGSVVPSTAHTTVVVHGDLDLLLETVPLLESEQRLAFFPHTNLVDERSRAKWRRLANGLTQPLDVVVGSVRSARGYPDFGNENLLVRVAPTYGLSDRFTEHWTPTPPSPQYDIGYFGRVDPDKAVHRVLEIANGLSVRYERNISVIIAGPESEYAGQYWEACCEPRRTPRIECDKTGYLPASEYYERMQSCRAVVLPGTSIWETWCGAAWEAATLSCPVFGPDWDGLGDAVAQSEGEAWPVTRTDDGYRGNGSNLSEYDNNLASFNGYDVATQVAVDSLANHIDHWSPNDCREPAIPEAAHTDRVFEAFDAIRSGQCPSFQLPQEFSDDIRHLTANQ